MYSKVQAESLNNLLERLGTLGLEQRDKTTKTKKTTMKTTRTEMTRMRTDNTEKTKTTKTEMIKTKTPKTDND